MHALAAHIGTGLFPQFERFRVVAELDADFLQDRVGIALDELQAFLVEDLIFANLALDIGQRRSRTAAGARRTPCCRSPSLATRAATAAFTRALICHVAHSLFLSRASLFAPSSINWS
ncbi:hypothetical protein D9M68_538670 [compost metagenome]